DVARPVITPGSTSVGLGAHGVASRIHGGAFGRERPGLDQAALVGPRAPVGGGPGRAPNSFPLQWGQDHPGTAERITIEEGVAEDDRVLERLQAVDTIRLVAHDRDVRGRGRLMLIEPDPTAG